MTAENYILYICIYIYETQKITFDGLKDSLPVYFKSKHKFHI